MLHAGPSTEGAPSENKGERPSRQPIALLRRAVCRFVSGKQPSVLADHQPGKRTAAASIPVQIDWRHRLEGRGSESIFRVGFSRLPKPLRLVFGVSNKSLRETVFLFSCVAVASSLLHSISGPSKWQQIIILIE